MAIVSKNKANTDQIFRHLCDQMDKLSAGVISVEESKSQANLVKQANNVLRYELDKAVAIAKWKDEIEVNKIGD